MKRKLIFLFFMFWVLVMKPQEKVSVNYNEEKLTQVIQDIELNFNVKFSYSSDLLNQHIISLKRSLFSLEEVLLAIENQTNLEFKKVSDRYYLIVQQQPLDFTATQQLNEVILTEYITKGIDKKKDGSISLSPKRLGILPGLTEADVLESLQLLPGVQSPSETASGLYIRGGTPDQNLILFDGIKMYYSGHFFGMLSAFNPYITENIDVSLNGSNIKYGNSISSVIDIKSINDIPEKLEGGFGFNMTHADAFLKIPVSNKFVIITSARQSYTNTINTFTFKNLSNRVFQNTKIREGNKVFDDDDFKLTNDFFQFSDFTLKAIIKPSIKDEIAFSSLFTKNKLDYGFLIEEFDEVSKDKLNIKNAGLSTTWKHSYSDTFSQEINVYYSNFDLNYLGENNYPDNLFDTTIKTNNIDDKGLSVHTNWVINESNSLLTGYQFSSNKVSYKLGYDNNYFEDGDYNETNNKTNNTHAFFSNYKYDKQGKWQLNLGLRGDYASVIKKFYLEPRLTALLYLKPALKARLNVEKRYQNISQILEFNTQNFGLENQVWALAQDDFIPLQQSTKISVGFNLNKNGWNFDVDFYHSNITGLTSLNRGFENSNENFSEGESRITGLDVLIKKKINNYRTWLSYTTLKKDFNFEGINNDEDFPGNFHIAHQINWSHSLKLNNFDFSLGWRFRTGTPLTEALGLNSDGVSINYDEINSSRLPNYHRLDFSSTYNFSFSENKTWKGKLGVSILNIYNRKNILNKEYKVRFSSDAEDESFLQEVDKLSLGFTPNIVFRVSF